MPVYEVEDPQGRTLEIEGDHLPTAEELTNIFTQAFPAPAQPAPERPALVRAPLPTMGPQGQQMLQTGMEQLSKSWINLPEKAPDFGTQLPEEVPEGILKKTGQAIGGEALHLLAGIASPIGAATVAGMAVIPEVVGPLLALSQIPLVKEGIKQTISSKDIPEAARGITKTVFGGAGLTAGLLTPLHGRLLPKAAEETAKTTGEKVPVAPKESEVADAIPKRETEEVPVAVPPGDRPEVGAQVREQTPTQAPKEAEVVPARSEAATEMVEQVAREREKQLIQNRLKELGISEEQMREKSTPELQEQLKLIEAMNKPKGVPPLPAAARQKLLNKVSEIKEGREALEGMGLAKPETPANKPIFRWLPTIGGKGLGKLYRAETNAKGEPIGNWKQVGTEHSLNQARTVVEQAKGNLIEGAVNPEVEAKPPPLSTAERAEVQAELSQALGEKTTEHSWEPSGVIQRKPDGTFEWVENGKVLDTDANPNELIGRWHSDNAGYSTRVRQVSPNKYELDLAEPLDTENPVHELHPLERKTSPKGLSPGPGAAASGELAKGVMRPGAQPYDPSSGALGIKPPVPRSLRVFATQDVGPFLRKGVDLVRATKDMVINAFSPASHAKTADVDILFKSKGYSEKLMTQAGAVLEHANDLLKSRPRAEQIAFIDRVKRGQPQPTPELQDIADLIRDWDDRLYAEAKVYKPTLDYLDNHLRVLWKTIPGKTKRGLSQEQIISKRPWRGSQGFTKRHVLDDMSQGIALGGEPVTYNPVEMFLLHAQDVMKFVSANRAWESLKGTGEVTFVKLGKQAPDDFVRIKDSIAKAYFSPKGMKGVRAQAGEWWVQKDAARMIENYLSRDYIRSYPIGRALMGLKNATTAIELGLSPFHAVFESLETTGSTFGLGLAKITSGDVVGGLKNILETPFSSKIVSKVGRAGIKYAKDAAGFQAAEPETYNWFVSKFPDAKRLIDDLFTGGGQLGMHQDYKWRAGSGFSQALQEGNYPGAVLRAIPALNQVAMKPLFETYIPRLKVGTFLREYSFELARRADDIASGKTTREALARKTWAFVEDRFGEMNFDNLYWNRTFKSALQLAFRSVTWKLGNLRGFGKAARDATAELGWRWFTEGRAPEMTLPMAWTIGMSVTTGIVSSLVTKAATGKYPWELAKDMGELVKNLVFPRISLTDESQRVSTPTYWRDAVHLSHSVPDYIKSSMSGEKGRIMDVWNNRDFYGVQVMNPDDPLPQKVAQAFQHLVPVPFGASSWLAAERTGATKGQALAGFFGFTKAPYYVSHTDAEQKAMELMRAGMRQGSRTREEFERSIRERQAVEAIKRGDLTGPEAVRDGLVEQRRIKQVESRATEPLLEHIVGRLGPDDAMRVYKAAAPEEKDRIKFRIQQKILRSRTLDPARKGDLLIELER